MAKWNTVREYLFLVALIIISLSEWRFLSGNEKEIIQQVVSNDVWKAVFSLPSLTDLFSSNSSNNTNTNNSTVVVVNMSASSLQQEQEKKDKRSRRKFISYTSSKWEQLWLRNIDKWAQEKSICQRLLMEQQSLVHAFLNLTCTQRHETSGWCVIHDSYRLMYYQTNPERRQQLTEEYNKNNANNNNNNNDDVPWLNFQMLKELSRFNKREVRQMPVQPGPQDEHIVSKFVFLDEYTGETYVEYIEPLVSHLRHPLARCIKAGAPWRNLVLSRSYIIPPPPPSSSSSPPANFYFDAGASSWREGSGGPSLSYFTTIWRRHGIEFDRIEAREMTVDPSKFYASVPPNYQSKTLYRKAAVSSRPHDEDLDQPFVPLEIERLVSTTLQQEQQKQTSIRQDEQQQKTRQGTYVLFKLDIDSPGVEAGSIQYLLEQEERIVDEVAWEHHVRGNYLMQIHWCGRNRLNDCPEVSRQSLGESYNLFLRMRQKGIRAHSWV